MPKNNSRRRRTHPNIRKENLLGELSKNSLRVPKKFRFNKVVDLLHPNVNVNPNNFPMGSKYSEKPRYSQNAIKFSENVSKAVADVEANHDHYLNMTMNRRVRYTLNNHNKIHNNMSTKQRKNYTRRVKNAVNRILYKRWGRY